MSTKYNVMATSLLYEQELNSSTEENKAIKIWKLLIQIWNEIA